MTQTNSGSVFVRVIWNLLDCATSYNKSTLPMLTVAARSLSVRRSPMELPPWFLSVQLSVFVLCEVGQPCCPRVTRQLPPPPCLYLCHGNGHKQGPADSQCIHPSGCHPFPFNKDTHCRRKVSAEAPDTEAAHGNMQRMFGREASFF